MISEYCTVTGREPGEEAFSAKTASTECRLRVGCSSTVTSRNRGTGGGHALCPPLSLLTRHPRLPDSIARFFSLIEPLPQRNSTLRQDDAAGQRFLPRWSAFVAVVGAVAR